MPAVREAATGNLKKQKRFAAKDAKNAKRNSFYVT